MRASARRSFSMCGPSAAGADVLLCVQHVWQGEAAPWSTVTAALEEWRSACSQGSKQSVLGVLKELYGAQKRKDHAARCLLVSLQAAS